MTEYRNPINYKDLMANLEYNSEERTIEGRRCLIVGDTSKVEKLLDEISRYKTDPGQCADNTKKEIGSGRANGCFANTDNPHHVFPALKNNDLIVGYDDPTSDTVDLVVFVGSEQEVGKAAEDFFSIDHPYGRGFFYTKKVPPLN